MKPTLTRLLFKLPFVFLVLVLAGPFADHPPETESVRKLFSKNVFLEPAVQGRPLPTNDWWTTLLAQSPFPGRMYAYPFTVSADASAVMAVPLK
jgi:hypothetical protein